MTDQLGTPRDITNSSKTIVWQWSSDPFGNGTPTGSITYNLRMPGQYYDAETGHNYNYFRDYDPTIGRYIESDLIGLRGGINTYGYVGQDPLGGVDPFGLIKIYGNWCGPNWTGGYTKEWNQMTPHEQQHAAPPVGPLDAACERHDKCYASCRGKFPCSPDGRSICFLNCDKGLESSAFNIGGFWGDVVGSAMARSGKRDAGPNAKSCPNCTKN
ncbi:MAG: RHS repeat-associated core domain-containing protein [Gammaproteobacteria bacterium]